MNDQFYTLQEVAEILKVKYLTVFRWTKSGKLPAFKFGKQYRVSGEALQEFIKAAKVKTNQEEPSV